jgi:prefoldin subunit 5
MLESKIAGWDERIRRREHKIQVLDEQLRELQEQIGVLRRRLAIGTGVMASVVPPPGLDADLD